MSAQTRTRANRRSNYWVGWILNVVYASLLVVLSPWLCWVDFRTAKYRHGAWQRLTGHTPRRRTGRPGIWLHAVSVGEVQLLGDLLEHLQRDRPDVDLILTVGTRSGWELARRRYGRRMVCYSPLDFTWSVRRALRRLKPDVLVLAELELWPNLIGLARRDGVRLVLVNGRMSERSYRGYRRIRPLIRPVLSVFDALGVQNDTYADRFCALGAPRAAVHVTGSLKFDRAKTDRNDPAVRRLRQVSGLGDEQIVFLAGSTQEGEESMALAAFERCAEAFPNLRLIVVPRHPQRFAHVAELLAQGRYGCLRRSTFSDPDAAGNGSWRVLLVDTVGELAHWWGTAHIGYVGGSMGRRGGQNMLEPAAFGVATCFGPHTQNFRDVVAGLLAARAAKVVTDTAELEAFLVDCLRHPQRRRELGRRARQVVLDSRGALDRTYLLIAGALDARHRGVPHGRRRAG